MMTLKHRTLTIHQNGLPCYEIRYDDSFSSLPGALRDAGLSGRRICVVTDDIVAPLYLEEVQERLSSVSGEVLSFVLPHGEQHKTLDNVRMLYRFLIENHFDRSCVLTALGGGVIGDMTGYAAATYLRGVDLVQIPTTLLSQADSSIGGKTGVDFDGFKNMVGAFKMPRLVFSSVSVLKTLDGRQFSSGFAEIMKHGLIRDRDYYVWLIDHLHEILDRDPGVLQDMLYRSNEIKKEVVERDPLEKGERMLLNFGHTIGHAIEKQSGFTSLHGECVALGCVAAAWISWKRDLLSVEEFDEIRDMFVPFGLPVSLDSVDAEEIVRLTKSDKKMKDGRIRFVLLRSIGSAFVAPDVTETEMEEAVNALIYAGG